MPPVANRAYEWGHQWARVEYGAGCTESLASEIERLGISRPFLISTPSLAQSELLDRVRSIVSPAGEFIDCVAHVPEPVALAAAVAAEAVGADGLLAVGGSSVVDTSKAVNVPRLAGSFELSVFADVRAGRSEMVGQALPLITIPTTLSGAEYTSLLGTTDEADIKQQIPDPRLGVDSILLDPEATVTTPEHLWKGAGVKTMSDAVEQFSYGGNVVSDTLCLRSIELFLRGLPGAPEDLDARLSCLQASWMSLFALQDANGAIGLSGALRHQVAVSMGAAHGDVTCVLLPHVMRFNAPAVADRGLRLAFACGVSGAASDHEAWDASTSRLESFIRDLGLPARLRDIADHEADLDALAGRVLDEKAAQLNPRPVQSRQEIVDLLRAAW